jgi:hypothetical protein
VGVTGVVIVLGVKEYAACVRKMRNGYNILIKV